MTLTVIMYILPVSRRSSPKMVNSNQSAAANDLPMLGLLDKAIFVLNLTLQQHIYPILIMIIALTSSGSVEEN